MTISLANSPAFCHSYALLGFASIGMTDGRNPSSQALEPKAGGFEGSSMAGTPWTAVQGLMDEDVTVLTEGKLTLLADIHLQIKIMHTHLEKKEDLLHTSYPMIMD